MKTEESNETEGRRRFVSDTSETRRFSLYFIIISNFSTFNTPQVCIYIYINILSRTSLSFVSETGDASASLKSADSDRAAKIGRVVFDPDVYVYNTYTARVLRSYTVYCTPGFEYSRRPGRAKTNR